MLHLLALSLLIGNPIQGIQWYHSMTPNLGSGPHFWNSSAFPRIAMTLVCCQWHNRQVWSTESDRSKLLTLIAAVYLPHCCVRLILSYCYDFLLLC